MKFTFKLVAFAMFAFALSTTAWAQNKFIGSVKYSIEAAGKTQEIILKVYEGNAMYKTEASQVLVKGRKIYTPQDLSQYISFLRTNDVWDSPYEGDGKILIKHELEQKDIDSLTIPCTEGFYFEYIDGETKEIAGQKAKKARYHLFNDEGEDKGFAIARHSRSSVFCGRGNDHARSGRRGRSYGHARQADGSTGREGQCALHGSAAQGPRPLLPRQPRRSPPRPLTADS